MSDTATVVIVKRTASVAGQYQISATVAYPDEVPSVATFVGSTYGGPIVLIMPSGAQMFVSAAVMERCGPMLTEEWVRAFFA